MDNVLKNRLIERIIQIEDDKVLNLYTPQPINSSR